MSPTLVRSSPGMATIEQRAGVTIYRGVIPHELAKDALRRLQLDVVQHGLKPKELAEWATTTAFPHLRWEPEVIELRDYMQAAVMDGYVEWCEPQIIYRFPDAATVWPIRFHIDEAIDGEQFGGIYAVPLTRSSREDGCLMIPANEGDRAYIEADVGDVLSIHPGQPHAAGLNTGASIRAAIYYRHR
jgi:hypothetical protein